MDEIKEGSLVRAVKGSNVIEGVVTAARFIGDTQWQLGDARSCGYEVTVLEKAAPAVPTEDGWYVDATGDAWRLPVSFPLDPEYAPYTRLEPVPVTVEKAIDRLIESGAIGAYGEVARALREFGVVA